MKTAITFNIDTTTLMTLSDEYIAALWYIAQNNPVPHGDHDAGVLVEHIGREIIQRWMRGVPVPVWNIQGSDHYHKSITQFARWNGVAWVASAAGERTVPEIL